MVQLEPWKRVFVEEAFTEKDYHRRIKCTKCHNGNENSGNKKNAHINLVSYPSDKDPEKYCGACHYNEVMAGTKSLHTTQEGYFKRFRLRAGFDIRDKGHENILKSFNNECGVCHTSCGECHISRPRSVNSGMDKGHVFNKEPDLKNNCTACHGSRIGDEYTGLNEGIKADVHYIPNAKKCEFCHSAEEIHGNENMLLTYRYDADNKAAPTCEGCHLSVRDTNLYHKEHWEGKSDVSLSCQVCHSQPYKNCNGCHAGGDSITGSSYITFEIGRNYLKENTRYKKYDYITVRHIPIAPDTFKEWGIEDLKNFENSEPTWKMATPHNIQRWTLQTIPREGQGCSSSCHNSEYYLDDKDIDKYKDANYDETTGEKGYGYDDIERERQANKNVIIAE